MAPSKAVLDFLINHVVLPPQLPQTADDPDIERQGEQCLWHLLRETAEAFFDESAAESRHVWNPVRSALKNLESLSQEISISQRSLEAVLQRLGPADAIIVHVKAQNAGLLFFRPHGFTVVVHAFEASARSDDVMASCDRLAWSFPGRSVSFSSNLLGDGRFIEEVAAMVHKMSSEPVELCMSTTQKAQSTVPEERETVHPGLVTEALLPMLESFGSACESPQILKHVRDDVNWTDTFLPWRRSPSWLVVRASIQILLSHTSPAGEARAQYKNFMAFFMAAVCRLINKTWVAADLRQIAAVKTTRRLSKLGNTAFPFVEKVVSTAVGDVNSALKTSWLGSRVTNSRPIAKLCATATDDDYTLALSNSHEYLRMVAQPAQEKSETDSIEVAPGPCLRFTPNGLPSLELSVEGLDNILLLTDFESWIMENLHSWTEAQDPSDASCESLLHALYTYKHIAFEEYKSCPTLLSVMLLTILEIWRALDTISLQLYPMMKGYPPELPTSAGFPLLLPHLCQLNSLDRIEQYLAERWRNVNPANPSIFGPLTEKSFSVRYFEQSRGHQDLRRKIEEEASERRERKKSEWQEKSNSYRLLLQQASSMSHTYSTDRWGDSKHGRSCQRCAKETEAATMRIQVDEWPLPVARAQAQAAVFELDCPAGFSAWRDATWTIFHDLGHTSSIPGVDVMERLMGYALLKPYASDHFRRIGLCSPTKTFIRSHYRQQSFPVDLERIIVNNGLQYALRDESDLCWVEHQMAIFDFSRHCISPLPMGPYLNLQGFTDTATRLPNEAIASQQGCHAGLSTHEYLAFATLRAGENIQLLNILRELGSSDLSFNSPAVHVLIRQATLQAGTSSGESVLRKAHTPFRDPRFVSRLLCLLQDHLSQISANWKEQIRVSTITMLALRAVSLSGTTSIRTKAVEVLRQVRRVALEWCQSVSDSLHRCATEDEQQKLRNVILDSALVCKMSFDVASQDLGLVLETASDISSYIESSININDNYPVRMDNIPDEVRQSLLMERQVSRRAHQRIMGLVKSSPECMNLGVEKVYGLSDFAGRWKRLHGTGKRWRTCSPGVNLDGARRACQYDLLTGDFRVNGRRVGRLPTEYTQMPIYERIFGPRILSVVESYMPGMEYRTLKTIHGHEVHVGMENGNLIIEAIAQGCHFRLIPHEILEPDLPKHLTEDFVHWMNIDSQIIEFRPLESPWDFSEGHLELHFTLGGKSYMQLGKKKLVDERSELGKSILDVLQTLETRHRIMVSADSDEVQAHLPRFRLSFFVNEKGMLESQQLGAVIDHNQDIGCLYGLRNKLALRSTAAHPGMSERSLIIPYGRISISKRKYSSCVELCLEDAKQIRFMRYHLSEKLSQLRGHSGATSKLFLAYLHAITSSGLPDPLTSHSGTHEALRILREQSLRVSTPLDSDALFLLELIAALTPERHFYPEHLRKMQTARWNDSLNQLAQHEEFATLVQEILSYSHRLSMLFGGEDARPVIASRGDPHLLERAKNRSCSVRNTVLGAVTRHSSVYLSRHDESNSPRAQRVFEISSLVRQWPQRVDVVLNLFSQASQWDSIGGYGTHFSPLAHTCNDLVEFHLGRAWGAVYDFCRRCRRDRDQYKLLHLFTMVVFAQDESMPLARTLLAIASSGQFADTRPSKQSYELGQGDEPTFATVRSMLESHIPAPTRNNGERQNVWRSRLAQFKSEKATQLDLAAANLMQQWPCDNPSLPRPGNFRFNPGAAMELGRRFLAWNDNRKFRLHLEAVQAKLNSIHSTQVQVREQTHFPKAQLPCDEGRLVVAPTLMDLLSDRDATSPRQYLTPYHAERPRQHVKNTRSLLELDGMLKRLRAEGDDTRQRYANDIQASLESLKAAEIEVTPEEIPCSGESLVNHRLEVSRHVQAILQELGRALGPQTASENLLHSIGMWPRIGTASLLSCLSARYRNEIPDAWRRTLASLGQSVALLQRSERLLALSHRNDVLGFYKEAEEPGHQSWNAHDYPDWLLIEIENNLTIREIQVEVARKMICPTDGKNAVLQLNMGEGKSSVIVPMVMTVLADGQQLARIVVIKPLLKQTQDLLLQRLGGLVDRRILHAPFTREHRLDDGQISELLDSFRRCVHDRGIVIALPEHMMSFRLMGRERLETQPPLGLQLVHADEWLAAECRDILDESDEILDPRFQLVYSMGNQRLMDGQPDRWVLTQRLLTLFAEQARILQTRGHQGVEVDYRSRSYPRITFLDLEAGSIILDMLVKQISSSNLIGLSFSHCTVAVRQAVEEFLRERYASQHIFDIIEEHFKGSDIWQKLHLLRGLIAHKVLLFACQQKRWMVNFGPDLSRCMMAVPFRAKGVPAISAEFGHPDVAVVLTCLSYYYGGLNPAQLRSAFEHLFRECDPSSEYASWAKDCPSLPIQSLSGVNLEDEQLWEGTIFPHLRYSKSAADYFMTSVVFPHEGKEFPAKLSASAWDMPSETRPTTGFSGTNDNKFLLPLSIPQKDLPRLHRTNAMVVCMLLRDENRGYIEAKDPLGKKLDTTGLLELLCTLQPPIQVLIDVGAQVLESTNDEVAKEWLALSSNAKAAVYFDASDELLVVERGGFVERLVASPYHRNLDGCLIYLDEVHTRGVDLSMPANVRAAVTLGPKTTKDRLVQACMRLRKLGCYQSLMFLAPPEVHREIRTLADKPEDTLLDSADVVRWCFEQTCRGTDNMKPLWIMQGLEHCYRTRLCTELLQPDNEVDGIATSCISSFCSLIKEPEGRSLEDMYGTSSKHATFRPCITDEEARQNPTVRLLLSEWETFTDSHDKDWTLQEEQEREIAHEVEQERELQRPPPAAPHPQTLKDAVLRFICTGRMPKEGGVPFAPAFDSLRLTSAHRHLHVKRVPVDLLVTEDFANTVKLAPHLSYDEFLRPVKWILSSRLDAGLLLLISPYEANALLAEIRTSTKVRLHTYSATVSKSMSHFDDLSFYTVSAYSDEYMPAPLSMAQLSLFAGSLFFENFAAYKMACDFLGILNEGGDHRQDVQIGSDGFVDSRGRFMLEWPVDSPFERSPIVFLIILTGLRRKGHLYSQTHLGHLLARRILTEHSFDKA